jgi:hypothetical protein
MFEHDPVYTVGLRGHLYSAEEEQRLRNTGAEFHRSLLVDCERVYDLF